MLSPCINFQTLPEGAGFIPCFIALYCTKYSLTFRKKHANIRMWQAFSIYLFPNKLCWVEFSSFRYSFYLRLLMQHLLFFMWNHFHVYFRCAILCSVRSLLNGRILLPSFLFFLFFFHSFWAMQVVLWKIGFLWLNIIPEQCLIYKDIVWCFM